MTGPQRRKAFDACALIASLTALALVAGCASPQPKASTGKRQTKEYFPESKYGKASPRVSNKRSNLPRGGGRDQVGKPYQIAGKWYYPKEQPGYAKTGKASWYGDAFHGRLTANGEIYDMTHLTAAHPTMPLPSYARVTNLKNGSSVIVRVNDRGPYAHGRVVDLSRRAAELLDYTHSGIADVKVEYVSRAPLHGQDDSYLMASYRPGKNGPDPSDGLATGVMIAMAGPTPTANVPQAAAFPGQMTSSTVASAAPAAATPGLELPDYGPMIADRPFSNGFEATVQIAALGYADARVDAAAKAFDRFDGGLSPAEILRSWQEREVGADRAYVAVGSFAEAAEAERQAAALAGVAEVAVATTQADGRTWFAVTARPDSRMSIDDLLQRAWSDGASDAFIVRD